MNKEMKELFELFAILSEPVYTLAEYFAIVNNRINNQVSNEYEESIDPIMEFKESFRKMVYFYDENKLAFLRFAAELSDKKGIWEPDVNSAPFELFIDFDFIYLFKKDENYYLVFPDELKELFREITSDKNFAGINTKLLEQKFYATALLELYGIYDIYQFIEVWNHHHKDKITYKEAETFFIDRSCYEPDYYFEKNYIVHNRLNKTKFNELLEIIQNKKYYMPTKSVLMDCYSKIYEYRLPGDNEIDAFIAEYIENEYKLEKLQFEIKFSCEHLKKPAELSAILIESDMPVENTVFMEKFERLYNNLRNNTHVWTLRGFTLYQYRNETNKSIPEFHLPRNKYIRNGI